MAARLQGKVALITGASNGVGEATARRFADEGAAVVICARNDELLQQVARDIESSGGRALAVCADITDEATVKSLVAQAVERFGKLDILVNNANSLVPGMLADHALDAWHKSFQVGVDSPMMLMREAYSQLAGNGGAVVNVSSVCADLATPGLAGYSAAKSALQSLTRNAAIEWARSGVRVNAIVIGIVMLGEIT